jgi:hypothetical protein
LHDGLTHANLGPLISPIPAGPRSSNFSLDVPIYHSLPSAAAKIYLDFDGDFTPDWGDYHPGLTPAYGIDTDASTFSAEELSNIHQIWSRVSEKFSPFNLDVTTEDPGSFNDNQAIHVVIGGDGRNGQANYWLGQSAGGVAYVNAFSNNYPNTAFVFPGRLGNGDPKIVAEASSHESGHTFGLFHQSLYSPQGALLNEYNPGDAQRAPVMGRSYDAERGLWWNGPSVLPSSIQRDADTIGNNIFGLRPDDHGNTRAQATPLVPDSNTVHASGVISDLFHPFLTDTDYFSFQTQAGEVAFTLDVAPFGPMLDASLFLYDQSGQLLAQSATPSLGESLDLNLPSGLYYLAVSGAGSYGDLGQYWLNGTIVPVPEPASAAAALLTASVPILHRRSACRSRRA